tara:strand:- start:3481 stop:3915 length:435 start_codon:yes stop_codon:yes gene_type:complete
MAFTGNFMCTSFKVELMKGVHDFTNSSGNTFNIALYTNSASFTAATTAYTSSNEVTGTAYVAKGNALVNVTPTSTSTTAFTDFGDSTWSTSTITARGAMIFNDTASGDPSVVILDFGADKSSSAGDFVVVMPTADSSSAIIRIA